HCDLSPGRRWRLGTGLALCVAKRPSVSVEGGTKSFAVVTDGEQACTPCQLLPACCGGRAGTEACGLTCGGRQARYLRIAADSYLQVRIDWLASLPGSPHVFLFLFV
ncbi:unnamed protein product, partial [Polarella glacialis]